VNKEPIESNIDENMELEPWLIMPDDLESVDTSEIDKLYDPQDPNNKHH
jgi:hypothetical protein